MSLFDLHDLFLRYRHHLTRFLHRRVASPDAAADLAQEAFLRLAQAAPGAELRDPRAYLFRTASNLAVDFHRSQASERLDQLSDFQWEAVPDRAPSPERVAVARQELRRLQAAIDRLPPRAREVFILARIEGCTFAAVGERLGISHKTAFSHFVAAMERLTHDLENYP